MSRALPAVVVALALSVYPGCYALARRSHLVVRNDMDRMQTGDQGIGGLPVADYFAPLCWLEERFWAVAHRHGTHR